MQSNERVRDRRWRPVRMGSRLALACVVLLAALPLQAARQAKTAAASGEGEFEASLEPTTHRDAEVHDTPPVID